MHSNFSLLPDHIVYKIKQRNNIRRANTCNPALKLLSKEHQDAYWDNTHIIWNTIHGLSNRAPPPHTQHLHDIQQQNNNHAQKYWELFSPNNSQTLSNTEHTRQTDSLTGQHRKYKDITIHSPQFRSKRK